MPQGADTSAVAVRALDIEEEEATARAARRMASRDPEASALLTTQVQVSRREAGVAATHTPYDPMALYARLKKYYRLSEYELDEMDIRRFRGYVREAMLMQEEEQDAFDRAAKGYSATSEQEGMAALAQVPKPRVYEGTVINR